MTERIAKSRGLYPDFYFQRALHLTPEWLAARGIGGLILDIDNTITRWEKLEVPEAELAWLQRMQDAGISCCLLSNGLPRKKAAVAKQTGIAEVSGIFVKPQRRAFRRGLADLDLPAEQVLMVGDSVFTDIIAANRLGIWTCLVDPLSPVDFFGSKLYRLLERLLCLRRAVHPSQDYRHADPG